MPKTIATIEAIENGKVLSWTWRRVLIDMDRRTMGMMQIGQAIMQIVDEMRQRHMTADSRVGIRFQVELTDQRN